MLKPYDVIVVSYKKPKGGTYLVELPAALAPLTLHVPHHAEQLLAHFIYEFSPHIYWKKD
jgi:hypothetical protein